MADYSLAEIIDLVSQVPGWFYDYQMEFLYPYAQKATNVLEIGTFKGRSTLFWSLCNPKAEIITIDNYVGDPMGNVGPGTMIDPYIVKRGNILPVNIDSHVLAGWFHHDIDLLFIDGGHDYDSLTQDINDWYSKVNEHGLIVCHDYMDVWPTVKKACDDNLRGKFELVDDTHDMFVVRV